MFRGSKPGERRGGRKRDTPNRRTILADRILSIGLDHPTATWGEFHLRLVKDQQLPADTRMAVAAKCAPAKPTQSPRRHSRRQAQRSSSASEDLQTSEFVAARGWRPQAFEALLCIVQDAAADPKAKKSGAEDYRVFAA